MQGWSVGRKLSVTVGVMVLGMVAMLATGVIGVMTMNSELDSVTDGNAPALQAAGLADADLNDLRAVARDAVVSAAKHDPRTIAEDTREVERLVAKIDKEMDTLEQATEVEAIKSACGDVRSKVAEWKAAVAPTFAAAAAFDVTAATAALAQSDALESGAVATVDKIEQLEDEALTVAHHRGNEVYDEQILILAILAVIGVVAAVVVAMVVRSTVKTLSGISESLGVGAQHLVVASGQVSTAAQSLSHGATEQAASLEETSASMEEVASMTQRNAEHSRSASTLMADVDARVQESTMALDQMVASMAAIQESSQNVSRIIKTIDEIAFQTNILALNAAVEAARAGEAGMGFAVVADEVRNLAQRSAEAAKNTSELIAESIRRTHNGADKVTQASTSIAAITTSVGQVRSLVDEVRDASSQQSDGIRQVSQAMTQMEQVTQTTAATAEESAAASEELNAQSEATMEIVAKLETLVRGRRATGDRAATRTALSAASQRSEQASVVRPAA